MDHFHIYDNSTKAKKTKPSARLANITSSISPLLFAFFIQNFFLLLGCLRKYAQEHNILLFCKWFNITAPCQPKFFCFKEIYTILGVIAIFKE